MRLGNATTARVQLGNHPGGNTGKFTGLVRNDVTRRSGISGESRGNQHHDDSGTNTDSTQTLHG